MKNLYGILPILLFSPLVLGCGGPIQQNFVVTGTVTYKGEPAKYAILTFIPVSEDPKEFICQTRANEDGQFELHAHQPADRTKPVDYKVTISWKIPANPNDRNDPLYGPEKLPPKFQDPENSGVQCELVAGMTEIDPIDLNP
jgi:hypothetical protein